MDFPAGLMDRSLPVNSGDIGLIPGLGRFHVPQGNKVCVPQLLSPCSGALEPNYWAHVLQLLKPEHLEPMLPQQEKPPQWEARALQQSVAPTCCNQRKSVCSDEDLPQPKKYILKTMHLGLSVFPRPQWQLSPNLVKGVSPQPKRTKPVKMIYQSAPRSHKFLLNKMTNVQRLQVKI